MSCYPIGDTSIATQIAALEPGEFKLFPAKIYKSHDGVRMRAVKMMMDNPKLRFRSFREREGSYVFRVR